MNIFETYQDKIKNLILDINKQGKIEISDNLYSIGVDLPPSQFKAHISTNVAMVLSKINKKNPLDLAETLALIIKESDDFIENANVAKPGFINIKFKPIFWTSFIEEIIKSSKIFGAQCVAF